ncbi:DNA polymerase [Ruminococcus callidus]|uniref:DNA polymerase n=1 Tax=Ruminococcus callidus TaxID=40519 RepID=UPI0023F05E53|nr:DNA polymerase [Ruminococcus callidus]
MILYTIDIETRSDKDISKCGVYAYTDTPYFDILLFAYSVDGQPVQVVDMANGEEIPENLLAALADENVIKRAFNCNFERVCLSKYLRENDPQYFQSYSISEDTVGDYLSPESWHCSMIHARTLGLPSSLAEVGKVLGIEQQKMTEGKALIKFFCTPYDTIGSVPQFHNPKDYPEKWEIFKAYNKRDVEAELEIDRKLSRFPVPDFIWQEFYLDQEINDRGILVDMQLADKAINLDAEAKSKLTAEMQMLTGVENPNSVYQLLDWLEKQGYKSDSLGKAQVQELIKTAKEPVKSVLEMRLQLSKSSVKKYQAMKIAKCEDKRVRGMFSFYGASRTGRFCSKIIQIQNLPQNHISDLSEARELVKCGSFEDVQMLYDDVPDILSQLIRTAFIPRQGMKFIVADFSAIEARVIAWLAGEEWRMKAFANGEDIYCASASKMFGVPVVKHGENGHLRQKGKVAELACGYGGSVGAMKAMGADALGLSDVELKQIVTDWREASPHITELWWAVDRAVKKAIKEKTTTETHGLKMSYEAGFLFIQLPSGRRLAYAKPRIGENQFGGESVTYMGINAQKKWDRLESYGPKFVENCTQGIARDLLMYSMQTLSHCLIAAHVHDEMIIEAPKDMSLEEVCQQMARTPKWAKGLILRADGYECEFYKKD